jgi:hypothetical protein
MCRINNYYFFTKALVTLTFVSFRLGTLMSLVLIGIAVYTPLTDIISSKLKGNVIYLLPGLKSVNTLTTASTYLIVFFFIFHIFLSILLNTVSFSRIITILLLLPIVLCLLDVPNLL